MNGDIKIDGKPYRVDLLSYKVKDVIDFAPRASVPGGSVVMSDLGLYQPLVQSDFRHGFGFQWYSDASGYLYTTGNVDTRQDGLAMLMTQKTSSDTNNNAKEGFVTFNGKLWSWGAGGLRSYDGASWSSEYSSAAVNFAMPAGDYLFYCPNGARIRKVDTSGTHSDAGLNASSTDYKWLVIHNGYIFAGKDGTNMVHYSDQTDLSDLEGTTADPSIVYVGQGNIPTLGAIVYAGNLYISRQDGLWHLGEDFIARRVIEYGNEAVSTNFRSMAIVNGFLIYPIRDHLIQWNSVRVNDITPEKITDSFPFTTYGRFDNFVAVDNFLYFTARTNEATYVEDLICFDGTGFHKLMNLCTGNTDTITGMGYDVVNNRLWFHLDSTNDVTYYIQMQDASVFPYANFPTSGTHALVTSRLDMGFRRVQKSMTSIHIEAENLSSARTIAVYYMLDGDGTWYLWDTVTTNGTTELRNPGGFHTREFNYAQLKFVLSTDSTAQSPIFNGYTLRFMMRPDVLFGWNMNIIAATEARMENLPDDRSSSEILREIRRLRDSKSPIEFEDILGDTYVGYVTAISEQPRYRTSAGEGEIPDVEYLLNVNFVSVDEFVEEA